MFPLPYEIDARQIHALTKTFHQWNRHEIDSKHAMRQVYRIFIKEIRAEDKREKLRRISMPLKSTGEEAS